MTFENTLWRAIENGTGWRQRSASPNFYTFKCILRRNGFHYPVLVFYDESDSIKWKIPLVEISMKIGKAASQEPMVEKDNAIVISTMNVAQCFLPLVLIQLGVF